MIQVAKPASSPDLAWRVLLPYASGSASATEARHFSATESSVQAVAGPRFAAELWRGTSADSAEAEVTVFNISRLVTKNLTRPLSVLVERDGEGYLARCPDLPDSYAYDDDLIEAVKAFKHDVEMLHNELHETDDLSAEWCLCRDFLDGLIED